MQYISAVISRLSFCCRNINVAAAGRAGTLAGCCTVGRGSTASSTHARLRRTAGIRRRQPCASVIWHVVDLCVQLCGLFVPCKGCTRCVCAERAGSTGRADAHSRCSGVRTCTRQRRGAASSCSSSPPTSLAPVLLARVFLLAHRDSRHTAPGGKSRAPLVPDFFSLNL